MSCEELKVLQDYLWDNLQRGFIKCSLSAASLLVLFVKKGDSRLYFCINYRRLNDITVKNWYLIPLIQETLARLSKAVVYTKLDIIAAFNRIVIGDMEIYIICS